MDTDIRISVVMPAYNCEAFVGKAIESILGQTYRDFEFIIVDDGSTDKTGEIIAHYAQRDGRIRVLHGNHAGISAALNLGIAHATAPWIARMHADDIALPERLEQQISHTLSNPEVVLWGTYAYHINSREEILGVSQTGPTSVEEFYALRNSGQNVTVIHPTAMFRKEQFLQAGGYNSSFDSCQDLELFDRLAVQGPIVSIPVPLLLYRMHSTSITMHKFYEQRLFTRYIKQRLQTRLAQGRELSFSEFMHSYNRQ